MEFSFKMKFNRKKPYNDLPLLPPKFDVESKKILKATISASRCLAELKKIGEQIPNQNVLIRTIPRLEAQGSSEIENIFTTSDKLFQYASNNKTTTDLATKEAEQYCAALYKGVSEVKKRPICTNTAVNICKVILNIDINIRKIPGTAIKNYVSDEIIYTPPEGEKLIREKLANLEKFINMENNIDPLIRMAIMHYQFEAIHPFSDGNGRTGRILNILFLIQENLLEIPVLFLSRYIIQNKSEYYSRIRDVSESGKWEAWILFMLKAVEETAVWTSEKIKAIKNLLAHTCDFVSRKQPNIYSRELVEMIFIQPYCRINNLVDAKIAQRQTASSYLKELANIDVLKEIKIGREKLFLHPKFLKLLTTDENSFKEYK